MSTPSPACCRPPTPIRVALAGFKTEERTGLLLATQQIITMDFTLEVGALAEQITVTARDAASSRARAPAWRRR